MNVKWIGAHSNNYGVGRNGNTITKVVMHWIVGTLSSADATFNSPSRLASAHYGVGPTEIHQYVDENNTAWHAGNLLINMQSIGIEHQGGPDLPIAEGTYKNSAMLLANICKKHGIPLDRQHVVLHREIKATKCPGTLDVDRIISMAKAINSSVVTTIEITDQTKIDLAEFGIMEVQAIKSKMRADKAYSEKLENKLNQLKLIVNAN